MDKLFHVALKIAHNQGIFTYRLKEALDRDYSGLRVNVRLKNCKTMGVIIGEAQANVPDHIAIKDIEEIIDNDPIITTNQLDLVRFCANYYFNALGPTLHAAIPHNQKPAREKSFTPGHQQAKAPHLTTAQEDAASTILNALPSAFLLEGVTGSGKTMVYMKVAQAALTQGKSVLFLVPEISLTPQLVDRVEAFLGQKAHTIHSNITPAQKRDTLHALLKHEGQILIGARSAIFAPLKNLGLIVVDEEHDTSLKQDEAPRYHARDLALWRAKHEHAHIILGSATPSLESIVNAQKGKLHHLQLNERFGHQKSLPKVTIVDLKKRDGDVDLRTKDQSMSPGQKMCILSRPLLDEMRSTLAQKAQVLLFLNQRGYAKFGVCYQCGHLVECPHCSVSLTYYQKRQAMMCHQCKYTEAAATTCKNCRHESVHFLGLGTERLHEEVKSHFPDHTIVRLDRDVIQSQERLVKTLEAMHTREADILIGTQMVAKGHDFAHVGLVGVICADVALSMPDFRAAEKTFQLLTQVAGRAGRGEFAGHAIIQTFNETHPSIQFAKEHDVSSFRVQELALRKRFSQPPFTKAALIRGEHKELYVAEHVVIRAQELLTKQAKITVLGPVPSPIEKINQRFRFQCLAMAPDSTSLHRALKALVADKNLSDLVSKKQPRFIIDVDPYHMS